MVVSPMGRKLKYVQKIAKPEGIDWAMRKWGAELNVIKLVSSYNALYRFLLDLFLVTDLHIDYVVLEEYPIEFPAEIKKGTPGVYGVTLYGECFYTHSGSESSEVESKRLLSLGGELSREYECAVWELRYKATEDDALAWKNAGRVLIEQIEYVKERLLKLGVSKDLVEALEEKLAIVEAKIINASYVGFMVVGLSKVSPPPRSPQRIEARLPRNWIKTAPIETILAYESHVGFIRVGYARVISRLIPMKTFLTKELSDKLKAAIEEFHTRLGVVDKVLYPRVHTLARRERIHWIGGEHQIVLQDIIRKVKTVLDVRGVVAQMRLGYIAFAKELYYLHYTPHRRWKLWKLGLTDEDIVEKYKRIGLDENILREIKEVVKP